MIQRLQEKRNEKGFTLIELLIVIIVLGILAAIVVFAVAGTKKDAVASSCKTDVKSIELSAESVLAKKPGAVALTDVAKTDLTDSAKGGLFKVNGFPSSSNYTLDWNQTAGAVTITKPGTAGATNPVNSCDGLG
jgi:prepilin-type N-terminal cleavage/methylation domain-containing protein